MTKGTRGGVQHINHMNWFSESKQLSPIHKKQIIGWMGEAGTELSQHIMHSGEGQGSRAMSSGMPERVCQACAAGRRAAKDRGDTCFLKK